MIVNWAMCFTFPPCMVDTCRSRPCAANVCPPVKTSTLTLSGKCCIFRCWLYICDMKSIYAGAAPGCLLRGGQNVSRAAPALNKSLSVGGGTPTHFFSDFQKFSQIFNGVGVLSWPWPTAKLTSNKKKIIIIIIIIKKKKKKKKINCPPPGAAPVYMYKDARKCPQARTPPPPPLAWRCHWKVCGWEGKKKSDSQYGFYVNQRHGR